jgi:hypothetical protein
VYEERKRIELNTLLRKVRKRSYRNACKGERLVGGRCPVSSTCIQGVGVAVAMVLCRRISTTCFVERPRAFNVKPIKTLLIAIRQGKRERLLVGGV